MDTAEAPRFYIKAPCPEPYSVAHRLEIEEKSRGRLKVLYLFSMIIPP